MTFSMRVLLAGGFVSALVIACSGGNKPPQTSSSGGTDTTSDAASSTPPTPNADADAGATPPVATSDDAGSTAKPASTAAPKGDDDECVPVAVDFEKRARPKLKECYREGKKKEPDLKGTAKFKLTIDLKGKIKSTKVIEKTLPEPVVACMLKSITGTPFPEVEKCWDRTITIPITFPTL